MKLRLPESEFGTAFFEALEGIFNFGCSLFSKLHPLTATVFFVGVALGASMGCYLYYIERRAKKSRHAIK